MSPTKSSKAVAIASELVGSKAALARLIGVRPPTVQQWVNGKRPVPHERAVAIERVTGGAVTRRDLRPDDWRDIWPELTLPESPSAETAVSALQRAISIVGSAIELDSMIGATGKEIEKWLAGDSIPAEFCARIDRVTGGFVTRQSLRPHDWREIWPELAKEQR